MRSTSAGSRFFDPYSAIRATMTNARSKTLVPTTDDTPFGEIIRRAVEARGWSQSEFAARLGVSQPRVNEIFSQASMTEALLDRCVAALDARLEVRIVEA